MIVQILYYSWVNMLFSPFLMVAVLQIAILTKKSKILAQKYKEC
jgi:hypothetical protein